MSTTIIEKLLAAGDAISGKAYRLLAARGDVSGNAVPLAARDADGALVVTQSGQDRGSFGRLPVSTPYNIFDVTHILDKQPLLMDEVLSTGTMSSTHLPNEAAVRLRIDSGTASGESIVRQSFLYAPYQPGRSQHVLLTGTFGAGVAGAVKELGLFDASNGLFFRQDGTSGVSVIRRTFFTGSAVDTAIVQANWNLDTMDGSGPSGVTLDFTKAQVFIIEYGWLGVGPVRYGFEIGNRTIWCHQLSNQNLLAGVYMSTGSLPVRYSIRTTGTLASDADLHHICSAVSADGGFDKPPFPAAIDTRTLLGGATSITAGTRQLMLTLRLKTAYNRAMLQPLAAHGMADSLDSYLLELVLGGTRSGGSPTTTAASDAVEAITGETTLTGGRRLAVILADGSTNRSNVEQLRSRLPLASKIDGTPQEVSVVMTAFSTGNFYAGLSWGEVY